MGTEGIHYCLEVPLGATVEIQEDLSYVTTIFHKATENEWRQFLPDFHSAIHQNGI